jgi:hypothetical protein
MTISPRRAVLPCTGAKSVLPPRHAGNLGGVEPDSAAHSLSQPVEQFLAHGSYRYELRVLPSRRADAAVGLGRSPSRPFPFFEVNDFTHSNISVSSLQMKHRRFGIAELTKRLWNHGG